MFFPHLHHLLADPYDLIGNEEKKKRSLQGAVSLTSVATPGLVDVDMDADTTVDTDMDTAADTSSPNSANPSNANSPLTPPPNASGPQGFGLPASSLSETGITDHLPTYTNHEGTSEVRLQSLSPFSDDRSPSPSHTPSIPNPPTSGITPTRSLLTNAGDDPFDLTGDRCDFISEATCAYWQSVPGGGKWVAMVKRYLILEGMARTKGVSTISHCIQSQRSNNCV